MKRTLGIALILLGVMFAAWCAVVGGSFSFVYLLYLVTQGSEVKLGQLALLFSLTIGGIATGVFVVRLGMRFRESDPNIP